MPDSPKQYRAVVVTDRAQPCAAGVEAMKGGGNAIDAAVAAAMVHCVISPSYVGFAGYGGSMVVWIAKERRTYAIDFDARAPLAFRPELFNDVKAAQHGYLSVGVPGVVAGLDLALRRFGKTSFKTAATAALDLAANGSIVTAETGKALATFAGFADADSFEAMFHRSPPPKVGEKWVQADLANFIREISEDPQSFYHGPIAKKIAAEVTAHGGVLTAEDFAKFEAEVVEPLHATYRGFDLYTPPPPSGGITSLSILKTLEQFPLEQFPSSEYKPWGPAYYDLFLSAAKLCWRDRIKWLGDPEFVKVPAEKMLSAEAAAERAAEIRRPTSQPATKPSAPAAEHTENIIAVDADGNCVSLTLTHGDGFGSHVAIKGLGLILGHGMSRFTFKGGGPNSPEPRKRMQHNMSPAFALQNGKPRFIVGLPGGPRIVTVTAQLLVSLIDFHATAAQAASAPRVHVEAEEPYQISAHVSADVSAFLEARGHKLKHFPSLGGPAGVAVIDPNDGTVSAASSNGGSGVAGI